MGTIVWRTGASRARGRMVDQSSDGTPCGSPLAMGRDATLLSSIGGVAKRAHRVDVRGGAAGPQPFVNRSPSPHRQTGGGTNAAPA